MVNDCQGRGRRYLSSIYYGSKCADAYVGALLTRLFRIDGGVGVTSAGLFFFPNFILFLIFHSSRPTHLSTFHFHFLFVKWRRVHGSPNRRDLEFVMPFCCLLRRGVTRADNPPTHHVGHKRWAFALCVLYAAPRFLFN